MGPIMAVRTDTWTRELASLLAALLIGAASGGIAGYIVSVAVQGQPVASQLHPSTSTVATASATSTTAAPTSTLSLIPLERSSATPLVPPAFLKRRVPSVASLYRRPAKGSADQTLGADRLLGQAVAVTSDGWFVTTASIFDQLPAADVVLWHDGIAYDLTQGMTDSLSGVVFLKVAANDLTPPAFAQAQDLSPGAELWIEARPGEFSPSVALSASDRISPNDSISSEMATRRVDVASIALHGDIGGAAWDPDGSLVGILDGKDNDRTRLIPASAIASSFSSLLNSGRIVHAYLGVHAVDLASLHSAATSTLGEPTTGALVQDDHKTGRPGVQRDSPALNKLHDGDVILSVEHDILDGTADLGEILAGYPPGTAVTLHVWRLGQDVDVPVQLGEITTGATLK